MFGYACDETAELMPAAIHYAHRLVERQSQLRKDGRLPWLRPDAKSQVTLRYVDGRPVGDRHHRAVDPARARDVSTQQIEEAVIEDDHQAGAAARMAATAPATWSTRPAASSSAARRATAA